MTRTQPSVGGRGGRYVPIWPDSGPTETVPTSLWTAALNQASNHWEELRLHRAALAVVHDGSDINEDGQVSCGGQYCSELPVGDHMARDPKVVTCQGTVYDRAPVWRRSELDPAPDPDVPLPAAPGEARARRAVEVVDDNLRPIEQQIRTLLAQVQAASRDLQPYTPAWYAVRQAAGVASYALGLLGVERTTRLDDARLLVQSHACGRYLVLGSLIGRSGVTTRNLIQYSVDLLADADGPDDHQVQADVQAARRVLTAAVIPTEHGAVVPVDDDTAAAVDRLLLDATVQCLGIVGAGESSPVQRLLADGWAAHYLTETQAAQVAR